MTEKPNNEIRKENGEKRKEEDEKKAKKLKTDEINHAIELMEILEMSKTTIDNFKKGIIEKAEIRNYLDPITNEKINVIMKEEIKDELLETIHELEEKYQFTCFYVMENKLYEDTLEALLISGKHKEEWEEDIFQAHDKDENNIIEMFSYVINIRDPNNSEFGYIGIKKYGDNYIRMY